MLMDPNTILPYLVVASLLTFTIPTFMSPGSVVNTWYQWSMLAIACISEFTLMIMFVRMYVTSPNINLYSHKFPLTV